MSEKKYTIKPVKELPKRRLRRETVYDELVSDSLETGEKYAEVSAEVRNLLHPFAEIFERYLRDIGRASTEAAKAFLFLEFARNAFREVDWDLLERLYPELERRITRRRGVGLRGRPDALLGNLIIEFEIDLDRKRSEAQEQLSRYLSILWTNQGKRRVSYLALASDGRNFDVYQPNTDRKPGELVKPEDIKLDPLETSVDLAGLGAEKTYVWLDRYLLYRTKLPPRGDVFSQRFGLESPAYRESISMLREGWEKAKPIAGTGYDEWRRYLRYVYGSEVASEELFLKHTYLANLAKLMVFLYYTEEAPSRKELMETLRGRTFERWGIINFMEEDFFAWLVREEVEEVGFRVASLISQVLRTFDLSKVDEDILKDLYQELVDPEERHDLGEYYTPDWVATLIVKRVLKDEPKKSILDPACGSGTFLAAAIREKRQTLDSMKSAELLEHIEDTTMGLDIHPLAVIISKANYLIALGDILTRRKGPFTIPVYMANSIVPPMEIVDRLHNERFYAVDTEGSVRTRLMVPEEVTETPGLLDKAVRVVISYASEAANVNSMNAASFQVILYREAPELEIHPRRKRITDILFATSKILKHLIEKDKDTIWGFVMRNIYRPLFFSKRKFDALVGNPPWLSFRYIEDTFYQRKIKDLMKRYGVFPTAELITHMEMGTLFLLRAADLYLDEGGTICFVMPRSVFVADQHDKFRKGAGGCGVTYLADLDVKPLFEVPACIVEAVRGGKTIYPVKGETVRGKLPRKNAALEEAKKNLIFKDSSFVLNVIGKRSFITEGEETIEAREGPSAYYVNFYQGATIVPRGLWFVEVHPHYRLGLDPENPPLQTSRRARKWAKRSYKGLALSGKVEAKFLYRTVTGSELVPFARTDLPLVVLPIESTREAYRLVDRQEAVREGFTGLAKWLARAEEEWNTRRSDKAYKMDVYGWLDYQNKLTQQNPQTKFLVVYNTSGTYLTASVIEQGTELFEADGQFIDVGPVIAECTVYSFETDSEEEAHYLVSVLNSALLNTLLKPLQAKGQFGPRHFHKKPLEFPIQRYDPSNEAHTRLAELGKECADRVVPLVRELSKKYRSIGKIRAEIRKALSTQLEEIDALVTEMFKA